MERKNLLPAVGIGLLACVALMLTVIGGLYAYNTFTGSAQSAYAQSAGTDVGPKWTVTPVTVGGNQEFIVVITEDDNLYDLSKKSRQMSVYGIQSNGVSKGSVYFVAARVLEWDSKLPFANGQNADGWEPLKVKDSVEQYSKRKGK